MLQLPNHERVAVFDGQIPAFMWSRHAFTINLNELL